MLSRIRFHNAFVSDHDSGNVNSSRRDSGDSGNVDRNVGNRDRDRSSRDRGSGDADRSVSNRDRCDRRDSGDSGHADPNDNDCSSCSSSSRGNRNCSDPSNRDPSNHDGKIDASPASLTTTPTIDITRFMKHELRLAPSDTVVVKMDIEGAEWPILRRWIADPDMPRLVDELFVEVHYDHPSMRGFHWARFAPTTRSAALRLLADLRLHGFYVHPWP
jgi:hypothetical protein